MYKTEIHISKRKQIKKKGHKSTYLQNRNRLVVSKGEGPGEGWIENLRLAGTNYHIENG